jgi:hypothetical protein
MTGDFVERCEALLDGWRVTANTEVSAAGMHDLGYCDQAQHKTNTRISARSGCRWI